MLKSELITLIKECISESYNLNSYGTQVIENSDIDKKLKKLGFKWHEGSHEYILDVNKNLRYTFEFFQEETSAYRISRLTKNSDYKYNVLVPDSESFENYDDALNWMSKK